MRKLSAGRQSTALLHLIPPDNLGSDFTLNTFRVKRLPAEVWSKNVYTLIHHFGMLEILPSYNDYTIAFCDDSTAELMIPLNVGLKILGIVNNNHMEYQKFPILTTITNR